MVTNEDLEQAIKRQGDGLLHHTAADQEFQDEQRASNIQQEGTQKAIHARLDGLEGKVDNLATKEDIAGVLTFMSRINTGERIISWSWNNMARIGSFGLAIIFIWGMLKFGFVVAVHNFFKLISGV